jgi:hypothetical protein
MSLEFQELDSILDRIRHLPPEFRVRLMQGILESLLPPISTVQDRLLQFGEYKDYQGPMSVLQDYAAAEWHPLELELDGE